MRIKKTKVEKEQDERIKAWKRKERFKPKKKKYKKSYITPSECMEHYQQYLRAIDVDDMRDKSNN